MGFVAPGLRYRRKQYGRRPPKREYSLRRILAVPIDRLKVRRARTSRLPNEASDSILERLPHDILWEIFLLAGISNGLPTLSKYFNEVLRAPKLVEDDLSQGYNRWLFLKVLDHSLIHDLNVNVKDGWLEKFSNAAEGYDTSVEPARSITVMQLRELSNVFNEPHAIDVDTLNRKFMSGAAFEIIKKRYPRIQVLTGEEIAAQIEYRDALISYRYNVLVEALKKAKDVDENTDPKEIVDQVVKEKDLVAQAESIPIQLLTPSLILPTSLYKNLSHEKALMVRSLVETCRCEFENEVPYLRACFDRLPYEQFPVYAKHGGRQMNYTVDDFKLYVECIVKVEKSSDGEQQEDDTLQCLYSLAERALDNCPIKDHETLQELAWLTLEVKLRILRQLLSAKSIESLDDM